MKHRSIFSGLLCLIITACLISVAQAKTLEKTIMLNKSAGSFKVENVQPGDHVILHLMNPSDQNLTFKTSEKIGQMDSWVVGRHQQRTLSFKYVKPFNQDVGFVILGPQMKQPIAQGTLFHPMGMEKPAAYPTKSMQMQPQQQPVSQPVQKMAPKAGAHKVRGYW